MPSLCVLCKARYGSVKTSSSTLPGKLGNPQMTLMTEPRMNQLVLEYYKPDLILGKYGPVGQCMPAPVGPNSPIFLQHAWNGVLEKFIFPHYLCEERIRRPDKSALAAIDEFTETITGSDGNDITLFIAKPKAAAGTVVHGIVHVHGGGMCFMSANDATYSAYRRWLGCYGFAVISVEFRNSSGKLGPFPYPAGLNDCMSALAWVNANRLNLGVSGKLILSGESGGGNLCTAMAIRAKREGRLGEFDGVFSMCPFVAGPDIWKERSLPSLVECDGYFVDIEIFKICAKLYDPNGKHATDPCVWPSFAETSDLKGLPPHFISCMELDPLRDEGLEYCKKLQVAGVPTDSIVIEGAVHCGDLLCVSVPGAEHIFEATLARIKAFCEGLVNGNVELELTDTQSAA